MKLWTKKENIFRKIVYNWLYCIENGINFKNDIIKQIQPNIQLNSV